MSRVDMSAAAVRARLSLVSAMTVLDSRERLDAKIDLGPRAISQRLRTASELRDLCLHLGQFKTRSGASSR